jgi:hypothetical protein
VARVEGSRTGRFLAEALRAAGPGGDEIEAGAGRAGTEAPVSGSSRGRRPRAR